jgi:hypothetical protein
MKAELRNRFEDLLTFCCDRRSEHSKFQRVETEVFKRVFELGRSANGGFALAYARKRASVCRTNGTSLRAFGKNDRNARFFGLPFHFFRTLLGSFESSPFVTVSRGGFRPHHW